MKITRHTKVRLTANPDEDYKFKKWNNGVTANPYITTVGNIISYKNKLAAVFELINTPPSGGEDIEPVDTNCPVDEIWYTTTDEQPITFVQSGWGANVISNIYENGKGIIKFDNDVLYCPGSAFDKKTTLETIILPNNLTSVTGFWGCSKLKSIKLSENALSIGGFGFCSSLVKIIIPNKVKTIGEQAFIKCVKLTDIIIGSDVNSIGGSALHSCPNLSSITILNTTPPELTHPKTGEGVYCNSNAINTRDWYRDSESTTYGRTGTSVNINCPIYVPEESLDLYKNSDWNIYYSYPNNVTGTRNILPITNNNEQ